MLNHERRKNARSANGWVARVADLPPDGRRTVAVARDAIAPAVSNADGIISGSRVVKQYALVNGWYEYLEELRVGPCKYEMIRIGGPGDAFQSSPAASAALRLLQLAATPPEQGGELAVWLDSHFAADVIALGGCACYFVADVDCQLDIPESLHGGGNAETDRAEATAVVAYLNVLGLTRSDIGRSVQVASATRRLDPRTVKVSLHIKVNILLPYWALGRVVATFITNELRLSNCGAAYQYSPDPAIYGSRNQLLRALGSCKMLTDGSPDVATRLLPVGKSSRCCGDHSVHVRPENPQIIAQPPAALKALLLGELNSWLQASARPPRGPNRVCCSGDERLVRIALSASGMADALGPLFDPESVLLQQITAAADDSCVSCYLDGTFSRGGAGLRCPFKGGVHTSNRARITVRPTTVVYTCLAPKCSRVQPLVMQWDARQAYTLLHF